MVLLRAWPFLKKLLGNKTSLNPMVERIQQWILSGLDLPKGNYPCGANFFQSGNLHDLFEPILNDLFPCHFNLLAAQPCQKFIIVF